MATEQEHRDETKRYAVYALAAMAFAVFVGFLFLFNFTSFFKLAVPL